MNQFWRFINFLENIDHFVRKISTKEFIGITYRAIIVIDSYPENKKNEVMK